MALERETFVVDLAPARQEDEAFSRRTDAYLSRALGLACYILGNAPEAEDATQEAMARAWKARRSLRQPDAFDSWIDRILVNTCRERMRRAFSTATGFAALERRSSPAAPQATAPETA